MTDTPPEYPDSPFPPKVETMLGFSIRSNNFILGRERIYKSRYNLHFVWITQDISENSRDEIIEKFNDYPIICFSNSEEISKILEISNTKILGFKKSQLSKSIYQAMKKFRINKPDPQ